MLSQKEMTFLLSTLKQLLSKMGSENEVVRIMRKKKPKPQSRVVSKDDEMMKRILFMSAQTKPTDYSRPRFPIGG